VLTNSGSCPAVTGIPGIALTSIHRPRGGGSEKGHGVNQGNADPILWKAYILNSASQVPAYLTQEI